MVALKVIIEGGGSTRAEQARLRDGVSTFIERAIGRPMPKVVASGSRGQAFEDYKTARARDTCLLLVDSEGPVAPGSPWNHVAKRDGDHWQRPADATDEELHFMVETMETWLVADPDALARYYGHGFKRDKLPAQALESHPRGDVAKKLDAATKETKTKGPYAKAHGLDLIGRVDPAKVRGACTFADRFCRELEKRRG